MQIRTDAKNFFVFDLDDTLYQEIDFLKSAYSHISRKLSANTASDLYEQMLAQYHNQENVFEWLVSKYQQLVPELNKQWLLNEYREHAPAIELSEATLAFMQRVKEVNIPLGLITDGRSTTQRNKLKALGIEEYFHDIIISEEFGSEKPDQRNYLYFENKYPGSKFHFFGDNTSKDFIAPLKLGWTTICVRNAGNNIHVQSFDNSPQPDYLISGFEEIELI
jgi:putative hydrolase of the HAD superfamily